MSHYMYNYASLYNNCQLGQTFIDNRKFTLPIVEQNDIKENYVICNVPAPCSNTNNTCVQPSSYSPVMGVDYEKMKKMSSNPKLWGPHLWYYLHYSSMNYPENPTPQQINAMKDFLCNLSVTIPCKNCSRHYNKYIQNHRENLQKICSDKNNLINFLIDIHNEVNKRNNKPVLSYEDAKNLYK